MEPFKKISIYLVRGIFFILTSSCVTGGQQSQSNELTSSSAHVAFTGGDSASEMGADGRGGQTARVFDGESSEDEPAGSGGDAALRQGVAEEAFSRPCIEVVANFLDPARKGGLEIKNISLSRAVVIFFDEESGKRHTMIMFDGRENSPGERPGDIPEGVTAISCEQEGSFFSATILP